jgi:hypothetical protein
MDAGDVLFGRIDRNVLNDDECLAAASGGYFTINVVDLPSVR